MTKLVVKESILSTIHDYKNFVYVIQLARMLGSISYYTIMNVKINRDEDSSINLRFHCYLSQGALTYEVIKKLYQMKSKINSLAFYKSNINKFNSIFDQLCDENSFVKKTLGTIRDKVVFHFDEDVVEELLGEYIKDHIDNKKEVILIQGESAAVKDVTYDLADDINLNFVLKQVTREAISNEDKLKLMAERLFSLMRELREALEGLLSELALPYCEIKEN